MNNKQEEEEGFTISPLMLIGLTAIFPEAKEHEHFKNRKIEVTCKECAKYFAFKVQPKN